jgi:hypothetical protein
MMGESANVKKSTGHGYPEGTGYMKKVWEVGFQKKNFAIGAWGIHLRGIPV